MSEEKAIQVRHVPPDVHRTLCVRAAQAGLSLSDYILREITRLARRPTLSQVLERIAQREPADPTIDVVATLREVRDSE
jgi:plasmid stability protein